MKVLQGPLLERGAGAGCELNPKFRKRGRAQDGPKLGPGFMPGQKKNRNSNRKMKVSGGSALPDRAGGLVFLELPVGGADVKIEENRSRGANQHQVNPLKIGNGFGFFLST